MIRSYGGQNSDCQTPYLCHCSLTSPVIKTSGYLKELIRNIVPLTIKALFNIKLVIFCADLRIYKQCFLQLSDISHIFIPCLHLEGKAHLIITYTLL